MNSLIKYFETLYQLSDLIYIYSPPVYKEYSELEKLSTSEENGDFKCRKKIFISR